MATSKAKIADLHCDLLSYLTEEKGEINNPASRCSWPQLKKGGVFLQVLALFTDGGKEATLSFQRQVDTFLNLQTLHPDHFSHLSELKMPKEKPQVQVLPAIENASGLCAEEEALDLCFRRFDEFKEISSSPILYLSLTWNYENRFGGGSKSRAGLKPDGKLLLEYLSGKQIAIDLSHASDALADEIFNHIDKKGLQIIPIASHSNFRAVCNQPRNLTDLFAKEIAARGGVIGLNFVKHFLGQDFISHMNHAKKLDIFNHCCFGADFFCESQIASLLPLIPFFYKGFSDASCYPKVIEKLGLNGQEQELLSYQNLAQFFTRLKEGMNAHSR